MKIVLIRPEISGNIGAVARVMKNFGFRELVIVDGCDIDQEARDRAKHANDVLDCAERWDEMRWKKFDLTVGTTAHTGGEDNVLRNAYTVHMLAEKTGEVKGDIGLIFGPEGKGLDNSEIEKCDILCKIPTSDEYPVMNLSHAVAVFLYELSKKEDAVVYELSSYRLKEVLREELQNIIERLDIREYRKDTVYISLKNLIDRAFISKREANTLIGFFKKVRKKLEVGK